MTQIQCEAVLSDAILQAARNAVPENPFPYQRKYKQAGIKNERLLILLDGLLDATQAVAAAVADNALDDLNPVPADLAVTMQKTALSIADTISNTSPAGWSLSMSGKELL